MHRMPYCASFRAGRFDFVIASAHIFFGKGSKGKDMRQKEIEHLAKFIQKRAETECAKVFDRDFFVVGDFNIEREGGRFFKALEAQNFFMPPGRRTNFGRTKTFDRIVWVKRESFEFPKRSTWCRSARCCSRTRPRRAAGRRSATICRCGRSSRLKS